MALNIKDPATHALAKELASLNGTSITEAVRIALERQLAGARARRKRPGGLADRLNAIALHCASLPILDDRTEDEILGYNERGMFD